MKVCVRPLLLGLCLTAATALTAPMLPSCAAELRVPLTIPYPVLTAALIAQVYDGPRHRAELWRESDCQYLYAEKPRFSRYGTLLQLESGANLNLGAAVGNQCINAISWDGIVQALATPYVTSDWKLK